MVIERGLINEYSPHNEFHNETRKCCAGNESDVSAGLALFSPARCSPHLRFMLAGLSRARIIHREANASAVVVAK